MCQHKPIPPEDVQRVYAEQSPERATSNGRRSTKASPAVVSAFRAKVQLLGLESSA